MAAYWIEFFIYDNKSYNIRHWHWHNYTMRSRIQGNKIFTIRTIHNCVIQIQIYFLLAYCTHKIHIKKTTFVKRLFISLPNVYHSGGLEGSRDTECPAGNLVQTASDHTSSGRSPLSSCTWEISDRDCERSVCSVCFLV